MTARGSRLLNLPSQRAVCEAVQGAETIWSGILVAIGQAVGDCWQRLRIWANGNREGFDLQISLRQVSLLWFLLDSSIKLDSRSDEINMLGDMSWYAVIIASEMFLAGLSVPENVILRSKQRLGFLHGQVNLNPIPALRHSESFKLDATLREPCFDDGECLSGRGKCVCNLTASAPGPALKGEMLQILSPSTNACHSSYSLDEKHPSGTRTQYPDFAV